MTNIEALAKATLLALMLSGCALSSTKIEPQIALTPTCHDLARIESAFPPLTTEERSQDWGRELLIATHFAREVDLYRSITCYKRALILMPPENTMRRQQAEFGLIESYWLGGKYCDALLAFESSSLCSGEPFPAMRELLIILHDCYDRAEEFDRAEKLLQLICKNEEKLANDLQLSIALREGDLASARALAPLSGKEKPVDSMISSYCHCRKSPRRAQLLNALLPGAGYYYVGQKRSALTSLIINSLFIGATYHFFSHRNYGAGLICASLESGWYIGGINGAGLAAKEYNQQLYETSARGMMTSNNLFPLLMLETSF